MAWFQDGTKLLISGPGGPKDRTGIWVVPVGGGSLTKLCDDAYGAVVSPDNSVIAFRRASVPELWLMNVSGGEARRFATAPPGYGFGEALAWSPDGTRVAFEVFRTGGEPAIQAYELKTGRSSLVLSDPQLEDFCWARNGRFIYSRREDWPNTRSSNLWETSVDRLTGRADGRPRRLTRWSDFNFDSVAVSADGRRLSFLRKRAASNVYFGELRDNTRLTNLRRVTFDEWTDWPSGWTRDGTGIFYHSDRNGILNIFRQPLNGTEPQAIEPAQEEATDARLSPDGRWVLYFSWDQGQRGNGTGGGRLMRVSVETGIAYPVFPITGYIGDSADEQPAKRPVPAAEGNPRFRCPSKPESRCVLSEKVENEMVFSAFDPLRGGKEQLRRIQVDRTHHAFWDLSPDGKWLAFATTEESGSRIRLLSLMTGAETEVPTRGWNNLISVAWAANGDALFATGWASKQSPLLRVSLDGNVQLLYTAQYYVENPVPSPDGRHLAFGEVSEHSNAWVVDNFR